uniref:Uncharacterized protein n=1 Tax=Setaria digitata TaxID=48799 RepID=A0A915PUY2_9BILA
MYPKFFYSKEMVLGSQRQQQQYQLPRFCQPFRRMQPLLLVQCKLRNSYYDDFDAFKSDCSIKYEEALMMLLTLSYEKPIKATLNRLRK